MLKMLGVKRCSLSESHDLEGMKSQRGMLSAALLSGLTSFQSVRVTSAGRLNVDQRAVVLAIG
jgi:hypothetical protein